VRAGRLISMVVTLQRHGRMTAAQLAAELEVSVRTVLRDVETLGAAGVPVYATQGAGGGIQLVDGWRTRLTGLTPDEARVTLLAGRPGLAALLGLGADTRSARAKLLQALPPVLAAEAAALDGWLLDIPAGTGDPNLAAVLRTLTRAVAARVEVEVRDGGRTAVLRPLGLVHDRGTWHVVHLAGDGPAALPLTTAQGAAPGRRFRRPDGFDLAAFWRERAPRP
jgi:predicted DNA-binding transcriptional regulator YafY